MSRARVRASFRGSRAPCTARQAHLKRSGPKRDPGPPAGERATLRGRGPPAGLRGRSTCGGLGHLQWSGHPATECSRQPFEADPATVAPPYLQHHHWSPEPVRHQVVEGPRGRQVEHALEHLQGPRVARSPGGQRRRVGRCMYCLGDAWEDATMQGHERAWRPGGLQLWMATRFQGPAQGRRAPPRL